MSATVVHREPAFATHFCTIVASDFVLKDRYGVAVNQQTFLARMELNLLKVRQWYWDQLDGYTFDALPILFYRSTQTEAQLLAQYPQMLDVGKFFANELNNLGIIDFYSPRRYFHFQMMSDSNYYWSFGNSYLGDSWNLLMAPGVDVGGGPAIKLFGGILRPFVQLSTLTNAPGNAGTSITVTAGEGLKFAVAGYNYARKVYAPPFPSQTTGTVMDVYSRSWPATPFDAVVWPKWVFPTVANAEAIRVTNVAKDVATSGAPDFQGIDQLTFTRNLYGTTTRAIQAGDQICERLKVARVWPAAGQPENGFEAVQINSISGNTLTVTRNSHDYDEIGNGAGSYQGANRSLAIGDRIAIMDQTNFQITEDQACGGCAHESGHGLGTRFVSPREALNYVDVGNNINGISGYSLYTHDASWYFYGNSGPIFDPGRNQGGMWTSLEHTPDTPSTMGIFSPYVMYTWWDFPNIGFSQHDKDCILASPFITYHPVRP